LVAVLWVVIVAGLLLLGVQKAARMHRALAHSELAAVQAQWLARAGVEQAMAVLDDEQSTSDTVTQTWYRDESLFEKVRLAGGWFRVHSAADDNRPGLDDESGRINLNNADAKQLRELKTLTDTQIDSLIDWRSTSDTPSPNGAKAGYYQHLKFPYEMRGKEFQTHRELLLVRGFEDRKFFGDAPGDLAATGPAAQTTVYSYQANRDPAGGNRVNVNSVSAQVLQDRWHFTPQLAQAFVQARSGRTFQNLAALLDVQPQNQNRSNDATDQQPAGGGNTPVTQITLPWLAEHVEEMALNDQHRLPGKINVNTASREVLLTLPGITSELVDQIITQRESSSGGFKSLADLLDRHVLGTELFRGIFEKLTVRSDVFSVESTGMSDGGVQRRVLAVIDRGASPMRILYWYQDP
jgi:DNA uptake protein ComE-like DNA-binding protein